MERMSARRRHWAPAGAGAEPCLDEIQQQTECRALSALIRCSYVQYVYAYCDVSSINVHESYRGARRLH